MLDTSEARSFFDAKKLCGSFGGRLFEFTNYAQTQAALRQFLLDNGGRITFLIEKTTILNRFFNASYVYLPM